MAYNMFELKEIIRKKNAMGRFEENFTEIRFNNDEELRQHAIDTGLFIISGASKNVLVVNKCFWTLALQLVLLISSSLIMGECVKCKFILK